MDAQRAPAALSQHVEIAARLRRLDDTKRVFLPRDRQILGIVAGDLQKHAAIRPALIGLTGRMQKARTKADAGRRSSAVADYAAQTLHHFDMGRVAFDVSEQSRIISGADAGEMSF